MTRRRIAAGALLATAALALAVPGLAQQQTQQNNGSSVLGQILDRLLGPAPTPTPTPTTTAVNIPAQVVARLSDVIADPRRDADRARDQYRHPQETLEFFQVQPGMVVVDYLPANGWFTRILAPWLGPQGRYIAMGPDLTGETSQYFLNSMGGLAEKFPGQAAQWRLGAQAAPITAFNVPAVPADLTGKVDRVLIFRELHNQLRFGWLHKDMLAIRKMLKPGGMVGIEDHRMYENAPFSMTDGNKGYLRQSDVIALMNIYGFDLVGSSEVNANPRDTKNWPQGVWMLPPTLSGATPSTRARMQAIGESDRMTLLFRMRP